MPTHRFRCECGREERKRFKIGESLAARTETYIGKLGIVQGMISGAGKIIPSLLHGIIDEGISEPIVGSFVYPIFYMLLKPMRGAAGAHAAAYFASESLAEFVSPSQAKA